MAVANSRGIRRVELVPADAAASPDAVAAIAAADQVVLAPGSLYTSILAGARACPSSATRSPRRRRRVVQVANLRPQLPETAGLDGTDHLAAVLDHGVRVDTLLVRRGRRRSRSTRTGSGRWGVEPVAGRVAAPTGTPTIRTAWRRRSRALL